MFPRVKRVAGRRYVYLVEGVRQGRKVRQKTLCYLGPLSKVASGVPEEVRKKVGSGLRLDWKVVEQKIGRIPLTFDELSIARRDRYVRSMRNWRVGGRPTQGNRQRATGELLALSTIATARFEEFFEEIGERAYRMK